MVTLFLLLLLYTFYANLCCQSIENLGAPPWWADLYSILACTKTWPKTKHLKIYLSISYGETDFGEERHWNEDGINMTAAFKEFREKSIKGAQLRKFLSNQRILLLSGFSSDEKALTLKDVRLKRSWRSIEEEVTLVCHKIHKILLEDNKISQDAATDIIDGIRAGCNSADGKAATRIISSLVYRFMNWCENKASGSNLIIKVMRPFLFECIIKSSEDIQIEWINLTNAIKPRRLPTNDPRFGSVC